MSLEIQMFNYGSNKIRTIIKNNEPWFVGKDICEYFGDTNYRRSLARLDEDEKDVSRIDTPGGPQNMTVINEAGLYSLLFMMQPQQANLPPEQYQKRIQQVKDFKRWITHEVIPAIRKHGGYLTPAKIEEVLSDPDTIIKLATDLKIERQKRIEAEKTNAILMHVNKTYTATEIAKELGYKSATALNNELERRKIQYKQNDTWVLYSRYADKGYVEIKQEVLDNGKVIYHRKWTQLGREFLIKLLTSKSA